MLRYTVERFHNGLLAERTTYDFGDVTPVDPPSLPNESNGKVASGDGVVLRGPWGDDLKLP